MVLVVVLEVVVDVLKVVVVVVVEREVEVVLEGVGLVLSVVDRFVLKLEDEEVVDRAVLKLEDEEVVAVGVVEEDETPPPEVTSLADQTWPRSRAGVWTFLR